jgi:hypothetical protein
MTTREQKLWRVAAAIAIFSALALAIAMVFTG